MEFSVVTTRTSRERLEPRDAEVPLAARSRADGDAHSVATVERLLSEVASAVMSGAEQAARALSFRLGAAVVSVCARYDDLAEPALAVDYDLAIASDEPDRRFVQFHERVRDSERVRGLGAAGVPLTGRLRRSPALTPPAPRSRGASSASAGA